MPESDKRRNKMEHQIYVQREEKGGRVFLFYSGFAADFRTLQDCQNFIEREHPGAIVEWDV